MDWGLALATTATGLVVVFAVLLLLIIIVSIFGKIMDSLTNKPKKTKEEPKQINAAPEKEETTTVQIEAEDGISEEVVAAISAAVATLISAEGKTCRIRSIKRTKENRPAWSAAGVQENTRPF